MGFNSAFKGLIKCSVVNNSTRSLNGLNLQHCNGESQTNSSAESVSSAEVSLIFKCCNGVK